MQHQKIIPNLWYDRQAEEAARFYVTLFDNSKIGPPTRSTGVGADITGLKEGDTVTVEFALAGQRFIAINGGPYFTFTPAISLLVSCGMEEEVDRLWNELSSGRVLIDLSSYPFSERYGWMQDRYGLSWQIMYTKSEIPQKIVPSLMFTGEQAGKAEEAIRFYTSIFRNTAAGGISRYEKGEEPDREGTVKYAGFTLEGQQFAAMDSALEHDFTFNEAVSLMVECQDQREIDYYWDKLTGAGGEEGICGWLKDRYGVSWQVAPSVLDEMLRDPDREKAARVTEAFLKMKKFDIATLERAYRGQQEAAI